jgi:outer membrane protein assembly factor BamA
VPGGSRPYKLLLALVIPLLGSCSNTRFLADGELLYTGKDHVIISDPGATRQAEVHRIVRSSTGVKPNNSMAGKRMLPPVGLWIYHYRKPDEGESGGWFYRKMAAEPVLVSTVNPELRCRKIESELFGMGYFHADAYAETEIKGKNSKKGDITYYVRPGIPFTYDSVYFSDPEVAVDSLISSFSSDLNIRPGEVFNLEAVRAESRRIAEMVQDNGYYYFNPEVVEWTADTSRIPCRIDMQIGRRGEHPPEVNRKYNIGKITVIISSEREELHGQPSRDTLHVDGIDIVRNEEHIRSGVVNGNIPFRSGDTYSSRIYRQTITRLNNLGIFKFINIQFVPEPDSLTNRLDMLVELVVLKNISLDVEGNIVTKSTGFAGPGMSVTLAHGNLRGSASKLQMRLYGGLEWQLSRSSESQLGTMSYQFGTSASVAVPGIVFPFRPVDPGRFNMPQTSVSAGLELLNKIRYYQMSSFNLGFGYQWNRGGRSTHQLYPVQVNSANLLRTTAEFDSLLSENPYIRRSFDEQFIAGFKYGYTYDISNTTRPHSFYFQGGWKTAGNLISLVSRKTPDEAENSNNFLGSGYSQFVKFSADIRYFRNFRNHHLGFRFYSGTGLSFGNSVVMPYVEQFYSGGSNSIRAFPARTVGPGGHPPEETEQIIDRTGDIKLEWNMEYRFRMTKVVHGAVFLDAGNVWLLNSDGARPGAEFRFHSFAGQLAVGTGFGLRFDLSFFILRVDLGLPLRRAYAVDGSYWLGSGSERRENATFNFAIGYPF